MVAGTLLSCRPMRACTIVAKNYLAQARVLARSFLEHHPDGNFSVLVIDELEGLIDPSREPFTILTPRDVGCDPFERMASRYSVVELSTAVKPWLLKHELATGAPAVTYLDPDIEVFGPLTTLDRRAQDVGLVLTPHNTEPIPDDGKRPSQIDIMIAGVYNLGYISLGQSREIDGLLEWWADRLRRDCRVDPVYGYFVDQRWFDVAPGFVSRCAIVREPEYNVAYWNAHSRLLADGDGQVTVNGRPLAFFHFSGFDPGVPTELSRHQDRIRLDEHSALARLCARYAGEVQAADYARTHGWRYTWDWLADGTPFTPPLRRLFARAEDEGLLAGAPFDDDGCEAFLNWAGGQQEGAPEGVNRALAAAYGTDAGLRARFAETETGEPGRFLQWAAVHGRDALELPARLLPSGTQTRKTVQPDPEPAAPALQPEVDEWGVNVVGYFRSELGVGEAGRQVVSALDAARVPVAPMHGETIPLSRQGHAFRLFEREEARFPINLICMNADAIPQFAAQAGPAFFGGRYSIGLWFWEVVDAPADGWGNAFRHLDEVWVATDHVAEAIRPIAPVPVTKVTLPIYIPPTWPLPRSTLNLPEGFQFLFSFDYLSVFERKNPLAVVDAFTRAFDAGAGASLVVKCINDEHDPSNHGRLTKAAAAHPDIRVIDTYLSAESKNALTASCDCYVSLHRSEGFGLTMAEAMYFERPVIATAYSGNLDFMTPVNSYLVDHTLVPIGPNAAPYPADGRWAEPDVAQAADLMREVFTDREGAAERGRRAAADLRRTHNALIAGAGMARRLEEVHPRVTPARAPRAVATSLRPRLAQGPVAPARSPLGAVGRTGRRLMLRLMKPLSAYQAMVNDDIARSVDSLELAVKNARLAGEAEHLASMRSADRARRDLDVLLSLHQPIVDRLNHTDATVSRLKSEQRAIPYMAGEPFAVYQDRVAGRVQGYIRRGGGSAEDRYRSFEDMFRGPEDFIRDRQRRFLAVLEDREPVLDLGCGRGEFMDLLREDGRRYMGVDSDPGMVARCHAKGHDVTLADAGTYLKTVPTGSLGAIFCAQVIEHLPYETLVELLAEARRALSPVGLFIAETVNPHSAPALKTFWVDLTHQHPIFPEVALVLCLSAGFSSAYVFYPNGTGDVETDRYAMGEYAVVATPGDDASVSEGLSRIPLASSG